KLGNGNHYECVGDPTQWPEPSGEIYDSRTSTYVNNWLIGAHAPAAPCAVLGWRRAAGLQPAGEGEQLPGYGGPPVFVEAFFVHPHGLRRPRSIVQSDHRRLKRARIVRYPALDA